VTTDTLSPMDSAEPRGSSRGLSSTSRVAKVLLAMVIAIGAIAALTVFFARGSLWEDEIIAITHTNQALPLFFMETSRNDMHPPLYFLQLDGWLALRTNTDHWALANSLAWAALSLAAMFFVARRVHGVRAAWIATALFAVMPSLIWSASTLRMYAALPGLALLAYFVNRRWFETRRNAWLVACIVAEVALAYMHAVEFFFVAFFVAGALAESWTRGDRWVPPFRWILVQALFVVAILPLAGSALFRESDASAPGTLYDLLLAGGAVVAGWKTSSIPALRLGGAVVFAVLAIAGIANRDSRARTLVIPIGAIVVAGLLGMFLKPIFKQPVFAANLIPFLVLGAAAAAARARPAAIGVGLCMAVLAVGALPVASLQRQGEAYEPAARDVQALARPGDVVVVPSVSVYWGIARYAIGPAWGQPLAIMPALNPSWSRLVGRIRERIGPEATSRLGLVPVTNEVDHAGIAYVIGSDASAATANAAHVWVVTRDRYTSDVDLDSHFAPSREFAPRSYGDELKVARFDRSDR
jgi:mannosyltransferase